MIFNELKSDIINGKFKPDEKIVIAQLAQRFNCSVIPIREALKELDNEGLVSITPYAGAKVASINEKDVTEIYLIRIELETLAAKIATPYITPNDIAFLEKKIEEMEEAVHEYMFEKLGSLNKQFHLRIYKAANLPYLYQLICELWEKVNRTRGVFALVPERTIAVEEHKSILAALKEKDSNMVGQLVREQKLNSMKALLHYILENDLIKDDRVDIFRSTLFEGQESV